MQTDGYNYVYVLSGGGSYGGVVLYPYNYGWSSYSDLQLKSFHGHVSNVLDKLAQLQAVYFTYDFEPMLGYRTDIQDTDIKIGLIAQDVQKVFPEIVRVETERSGGALTMSYEHMVPILIEGIKELTNEVNFLKAKSEYLLERIEKLEDLK